MKNRADRSFHNIGEQIVYGQQQQYRTPSVQDDFARQKSIVAPQAARAKQSVHNSEQGVRGDNTLQQLELLDQLSKPLLVATKTAQQAPNKKHRSVYSNKAYVNTEDNDNDSEDYQDADALDQMLASGVRPKNERKDILRQQIQRQNQILEKLMQEMNSKKSKGSVNDQKLQSRLLEEKEMQMNEELAVMRRQLTQLQQQLQDPSTMLSNSSQMYSAGLVPQAQFSNLSQFQQQQTPQVINPQLLSALIAQQQQHQEQLLRQQQQQSLQQMVKEAIREKYLEERLRELAERAAPQMPIMNPYYQPPMMPYYMPQPMYAPPQPPPQPSPPPRQQTRPDSQHSSFVDAPRTPAQKKQQMPPKKTEPEQPQHKQQPPSRQSSTKTPQPQEKPVKGKPFKIFQKWVRYTIMAMFMHIGNKKKELKRREQYLNDFGTLFKESCIPALDWMSKAIEGPLKSINAKTDYDVTSEKASKLPENEYKVRLDLITAFTESLMTSLGDSASVEYFPKVLSFFMALAFSDQSFLPKSYMFEFELVRLDYNPNLGYLRNVTAKQREMLIAFYLIIRFMLGNVLIRPWEYQDGKAADAKVVNNENTRYLLKFVASFLYHHTMDHFTRALPVVEKNLLAVDKSVRTQPIQETLPLKCSDNDPVKAEKGTRDQVMSGVLTKADMALFYAKTKDWQKQFSKLFEEFLMNVDDLTMEVNLIIQQRKKQDNVQEARRFYALYPPPPSVKKN